MDDAHGSANAARAWIAVAAGTWKCECRASMDSGSGGDMEVHPCSYPILLHFLHTPQWGTEVHGGQMCIYVVMY